MCKYCERKPVLDPGLDFYGHDWMRYDKTKNQEQIAGFGHTVMYMAVDEEGRLCIRAEGEDYTDDYYPKFCPECGADLRDKD